MQSLHTFRFTTPSDAAIEATTGQGTILASDDPQPAVYATVLIESAVLPDAQMEYRLRGWAYVGEGDLRPAAP